MVREKGGPGICCQLGTGERCPFPLDQRLLVPRIAITVQQSLGQQLPAMVLRLHGYGAWIESDGKPLEEYAVEVNGNVISCYVCSEEGKVSS